jgi:antitoxin YefM
LIDQATEPHQPIVIAGNEASAVLASAEDWQGETMHLLSVPGVRESIRKTTAEPPSKSARKLK